MFDKKEIEMVIKVAKVKREELLNSGKGTDLEYIQSLEVLTKLITAAEDKLPGAI